MTALAVALQYVLAAVLVLTGIALSRATLRGRGFVNMLDGAAVRSQDSEAARAVPLPSTEAVLSPSTGSPKVDAD